MNQQPHNLEAERAVLGSIVLDNSALNLAVGSIGKDDFFSEPNRIIFEKMLALSGKGRTIDLVTLSEELSKDGALEKTGGASYLAGLTDGVPIGNYSFVSEYARIVKDKSLLRRIISASNNVIARCFEGTDDPGVLLDLAQSEMFALGQTSADTVTYQDAASGLLSAMEAGDSPRVHTGIGQLDRLTGGFLPGELVLYTAETGVGKTLLAQQTRRRACKDGIHSLFVSAEMTAEHLLARELAITSGVEPWKLRRPERLQSEDWAALVKQASRQCATCRVLDGAAHVDRIAAEARRSKAQHGIGLVVMDYDELIEAPGKSELEQQANVAARAKRIAKELRVVVILISQLRKLVTGEDRQRPSIQRLYGSGAKSKHASLVIYVNRDYVSTLQGPETAAEIAVLKSRDGRVGKLDAYFDIRSLTFHDIENATSDTQTNERKPSHATVATTSNKSFPGAPEAQQTAFQGGT